MQIINVFQDYQKLLHTEITVNGWVKTCRDQKETIFIHLSDGTTQDPLQIVVSAEKVSNFTSITNITTGTSLSARGILVESPAKGQKMEIMALEITIYQKCPTTFPLQKVGLPMEFIRNYPQIRHRTNIMRSIFVVKSHIMDSINQFFRSRNYQYIDLPILTTNACEGGCQPLQVTSLLNSGTINNIPVKMLKNESSLINYIPNGPAELKTDFIDFEKDFFDRPVYLTVSNQLLLECFAHGLGYVYTITPATRGEPSQTNKHLATFNMLEWEFCFGKLQDNINIAESLIKFCCQTILEKCVSELAVLERVNKGLIEKIKKIQSEPFIRISHYQAIELLLKEHSTNPFTEEPQFDGDLSGEYERYLVKYFEQPVIVYFFPKTIKAFYMPLSQETNTKSIETVDCFDLLMDIGEVVGGSQRIWDEQTLINRMEEQGIDPLHLDWYVDLRRYGSVPHGGAGLGIERLVMSLTGMSSIKDCISFPITIHSCNY